MATDKPTTTESTEEQFCHAARRYDTFALDHERLESLRTIHKLSGELLAAAGEPVDETAQIRALCQKAIDVEDRQDEETDDGPPDFGGDVEAAMSCGETSGNVFGRAALAVEVLAILDGSKLCSKCSKPIADPQLANGTSELCATCADS